MQASAVTRGKQPLPRRHDPSIHVPLVPCSAHGMTCAATPLPCSAPPPGNDPLLSYINTYVASRPRGATPTLPPSIQRVDRPAGGSTGAINSGGGSGSGGGSASGGSSSAVGALTPDAQMWHLEWSELEVQHVVGRGSFGAVYRATWQETPVAVKVLFNRGAQSGTTTGLGCTGLGCTTAVQDSCNADRLKSQLKSGASNAFVLLQAVLTCRQPGAARRAAAAGHDDA